MAEVLFVHLLEERGQASDWRVESAGVWTWDGYLASSGAIDAMERRGIDIRTHRSRVVSSIRMTDYDLILTMERNHKDALGAEYPALKKRIHLLTEMSGLDYEVHDPMGGTPTDFDDTANEIESLLIDGFEQIEKRVSSSHENTRI